MALIELYLPKGYSKEQLEQFLEQRNLRHICTHKSPEIHIGDALRSNDGVFSRVMDVYHEGKLTKVKIANNKFTRDEMHDRYIKGTVQPQKY